MIKVEKLLIMNDGFGRFSPQEWDFKSGDFLKLPV